MSADNGPGSDRLTVEAGASPQRTLLYGRVLAGDLGALQVSFAQEVLDRYRGQAGYRIIRTNSAGRVKAPAGWAIDFGIADQDRLIHVSAADLAQLLPESERQHWLNYLVTPPLSPTFLTMRLGRGGCIDDGEVRTWP